MVDPLELRRRRRMKRADVQRAVGDPVNPCSARSAAEWAYLAGESIDPALTWAHLRSLYVRSPSSE